MHKHGKRKQRDGGKSEQTLHQTTHRLRSRGTGLCGRTWKYMSNCGTKGPNHKAYLERPLERKKYKKIQTAWSHWQLIWANFILRPMLDIFVQGGRSATRWKQKNSVWLWQNSWVSTCPCTSPSLYMPFLCWFHLMQQRQPTQSTSSDPACNDVRDFAFQNQPNHHPQTPKVSLG